jgi:hypothetical protein
VLPLFIEVPPLDLHIDIELKCPIESAPIAYLEERPVCNNIMEPMDFFVLQGSQREFLFKMVVHCRGLSENVMPSSVKFEIKSSDFENGNNLCLLRKEDYFSKTV